MTTKKNYRKLIVEKLWKRDYFLVAEHWPDLLEDIENAIIENELTPEQIRRLVLSTVDEPLVVQRCENAGLYVKAMQGE